MRMTRATLAERGRRLVEVSREVNEQIEGLHSAVRDYEGCPGAGEVVLKLEGIERKAKYLLALSCRLRKEVGSYAAERRRVFGRGGCPEGSPAEDSSSFGGIGLAEDNRR